MERYFCHLFCIPEVPKRIKQLAISYELEYFKRVYFHEINERMTV